MGLPAGIATQSVTVLHPAHTEDHGTLVPDWSRPPAATLEISGCSVQPGLSGVDVDDHRMASSAVFTVFGPPDMSVDSSCHVVVPGYPGELEVLGEPQRWTTGLGLDYTALNLQVWSG